MRRLIPKSRTGTFVRFTLACVVVIAFAATTTAVAGTAPGQADHSTTSTRRRRCRLRQRPVSVPNPGSPQTLLLVGSDHRAGEPFKYSNTDTMMLVHIDPSSSTINLLSVPRDLKVQIPEGGAVATDKLNAAYSIGGDNLLVKILEQQVFPGLKINHIIDVNFGGFEDLVNAIGCVYTDVDHRYYNNTAYTDYSSIDIQPGYQKLCGTDALEFVRFRHTDSDIVRNARQQDFLRWTKSQFSQNEIIQDEGTLLKIFGKHAQTDHNLHTTDGLINLFDLVAFSAGHAVKQVPFPAILLPCAPVATTAAAAQQTPCYVTADPGAEMAAFRAFMAPTASRAASSTPHIAGTGGKGGHGGGGPVPGLSTDVSDGQAQSKALGPIGIPIYYPKQIVTGAQYCSNATSVCPVEGGAGSRYYPRAYLLHDRQGISHYSYRDDDRDQSGPRRVLRGPGHDLAEPADPAKPDPDEDGQRQAVDAVRQRRQDQPGRMAAPQGVYWISNTLTDSIGNRQLVGIAASLTRGGGK